MELYISASRDIASVLFDSISNYNDHFRWARSDGVSLLVMFDYHNELYSKLKALPRDQIKIILIDDEDVIISGNYIDTFGLDVIESGKPVVSFLAPKSSIGGSDE